MKKLLFFALMATVGIFFTACEPKQPEEPAITLQGIKLNQTSVTLYEKEEVKLRVRYTPEEAAATAPAVVWYSDKQRVASVDDNGLVKADRVGTAVITAQCGQFEAKCTVEVVKLDLPEPEPDPEINFSLSTELIEAPAKGGTYDITITTDTTWKAACEKSWAHLSQTEGKGNATIQVTVDPAETESTLTQKITFSVGKGKYFVTIQRKGYKFVISEEEILVPVRGTKYLNGDYAGEYVVEVTTDADSWDATCENKRVTITKSGNTAKIKVGVSKTLYNGAFATTRKYETIPVKFSDGVSTATLILKQESPFIRVTQRADLIITEPPLPVHSFWADESKQAFARKQVSFAYRTNMDSRGRAWGPEVDYYAEESTDYYIGEDILATDHYYVEDEDCEEEKVYYTMQVFCTGSNKKYSGSCSFFLKADGDWEGLGEPINAGDIKYNFTY